MKSLEQSALALTGSSGSSLRLLPPNGPNAARLQLAARAKTHQRLLEIAPSATAGV